MSLTSCRRFLFFADQKETFPSSYKFLCCRRLLKWEYVILPTWEQWRGLFQRKLRRGTFKWLEWMERKALLLTKEATTTRRGGSRGFTTQLTTRTGNGAWKQLSGWLSATVRERRNSSQVAQADDDVIVSVNGLGRRVRRRKGCKFHNRRLTPIYYFKFW